MFSNGLKKTQLYHCLQNKVGDVFNDNAIHWQNILSKVPADSVNNKTHSALSKAGPGCAMVEVEHTQRRQPYI